MMDESHLKALKIFSENPTLSQRAMARALRLSLGKVNHIVNALAGDGLVWKRKGAAVRNGNTVRYVLTRTGRERMEAMSVEFLRRKTEEYESLGREIETLKSELGSGRKGL